jgi:enolase
VRTAVSNVNTTIAAALQGMQVEDQRDVDDTLRRLDGTDDLSRLGGNAVLAASLACCRAAAAARGLPLYRVLAGDGAPLLPMPMVNVLSGGAHAGRMVDVQDYLAVPVGAASFAEAMEWIWRVRESAAAIVAERGGNPHLVADEGGLALWLSDNAEGLQVLTEAIERSGLRPLDDVGIALDIAATQLYDGDDGRYVLAAERRSLDAAEMVDMLAHWCRTFPIVSVEDPLAEDDWEGWRSATSALGGRQLVGDDLFVTSPERLRRGIAEGVANSVLVKVNQNGTVSGAAEVVRLARDAGYATVVSARSGETEDTTIADLAVGWRSGQIKVGSLTRSERTAKWNRLLAIEAELGPDAELASFSPQPVDRPAGTDRR